MPTMAGKAGSRSDGSGVRPGEDEEDDGKNEQDEKDDLNGVALRAGRAAGGGLVHGEKMKAVIPWANRARASA